MHDDDQDPPPKPAESLGDFSHKPRAADASTPIAFHPYDARTFGRARKLTWPTDYVEMTNPLGHEVSAVLFVGPVPGAQPFQLPHRSRSDDDDDDDPRELTPKQRAAVAAHQCSLFVRISFAAGQTLPVPRSLVSALVTVRDGEVIGGHIPQLVILGDPRPPRIHAALIPDDAQQNPFSVPSVSVRSTGSER